MTATERAALHIRTAQHHLVMAQREMRIAVAAMEKVRGIGPLTKRVVRGGENLHDVFNRLDRLARTFGRLIKATDEQ